MIDEDMIKFYIDKVVSIRKRIENLHHMIKTRGYNSYGDLINLIEAEETKTLEANIQKAAMAKSHDVEGITNKNTGRLDYCLGILSESDLEKLVEDFLMSPLIGEDTKLVYQYADIKDYQNSFRLCSLMTCSAIREILENNTGDNPYYTSIREYLENESTVKLFISNYYKSKSVADLVKILEIVFKACSYHDIGMVVISGILKKENRFKKIKEKFPIDKGIPPIRDESAVLNSYDHQDIGGLYLEGIADNHSIFEDAVYHHSRNGRNPFSKIIDISHGIAVEQFNRYTGLIPSWNVFKDDLTGISMSAEHKQTVNETGEILLRAINQLKRDK